MILSTHGMMNRRNLLHALAAGLVATSAPVAGAAQRVTVFAAASLKNALDEVGAAWTSATGKEAAMAYAGSAALARQIEAGAPADIFIPADMDWMDYLETRKLIAPGSGKKLLGNRLVLILPAESEARVSIAPGFDLAGVLGGGKLAMGHVKSVPAGKYGQAALESLGVWHKVEANVAQAENVRAALKLVATGEAAAGIVYETDALAEPKVRVAGVFPASSHPEIVYPAALTAASRNPDAPQFLAFLQSAAARDIFAKHGFPVISSQN
ncbi:MAG: molybdate ABC transporter substrate-binding protein [Aestuariivirga sp.]|uniref:molybdate ABC transporter substrate-binding protein n=1 Tax=Aestuariivirga sp. TaxID=2650926 RepID=UPI0038CFF897